MGVGGVVVTPEEREVHLVFESMLADLDWLVPIAEAQSQYRSAYGGMTAAALLEDLWFDALSNFAHRHRPTVRVSKEVRGAPGDYSIDGQVLSHKSTKGVQTIAVQWDATKAPGASPYTATMPMVVVVGEPSGIVGDWDSGGSAGKATSYFPEGRRGLKSKSWAVVDWDRSGKAEVVCLFDHPPTWPEVWEPIAAKVAAGSPAWRLDVVLLPSKRVSTGTVGTLNWRVRSGAYVIPRSRLTNVPVGSNNRGTTIESRVLEDILADVVAEGLWTPLPMWAARHTKKRPPDLYRAQRADFDLRFSPVYGENVSPAGL